ncbi:hypothetical protein [Nisaea denitrificans]|uniref:hypothetical protein n=1 Tax=Nisaea denitrificans TaxID=390877 RepID=UPI00040424AD|nr:hypothetical protein [Nisaea denitrificans]
MKQYSDETLHHVNLGRYMLEAYVGNVFPKQNFTIEDVVRDLLLYVHVVEKLDEDAILKRYGRTFAALKEEGARP